MRRANGEGSIFKLSGKRRKPYAVRVTVGFTDEGKQQYKYLGYYENKTSARAALREFLVDPNDIAIEIPTLKECFDVMIEKSKIADSTKKQYRSGMNKLKSLHNRKINTILLEELEDIVASEIPTAQSKIKKTLNLTYKYAMKHEYVSRNLSEFIEVESHTVKEKVPFTVDEINELWKRPYENDVALILLYTGMRISELLELECRNVNLDDNTIFVEKSKTPAGVRHIPIHTKILPLIKNRLDEGYEHVITNRKKKIPYITYLLSFWKSSHTIHETRHTFVTHLTKCSNDDISIKKIVGHTLGDITDHYTHRTIEELHQVMNALEYK